LGTAVNEREELGPEDILHVRSHWKAVGGARLISSLTTNEIKSTHRAHQRCLTSADSDRKNSLDVSLWASHKFWVHQNIPSCLREEVRIRASRCGNCDKIRFEDLKSKTGPGVPFDAKFVHDMTLLGHPGGNPKEDTCVNLYLTARNSPSLAEEKQSLLEEERKKERRKGVIQKEIDSLVHSITRKLERKDDVRDEMMVIKGQCGVGKSTIIPFKIMDQGPEGTIVVVVEARKNVAITNHRWMFGPHDDPPHYDERMKLCVGRVTPIPGNQNWTDLVQRLCSSDTSKEIWWTSIGTVEMVVRYLIRCNRDKAKRWVKGGDSKRRIVFVFSDWEEKMPSYGAVIQLVYEYSNQIGRQVMRIMASNAALTGSWRDFIKRGSQVNILDVTIPTTAQEPDLKRDTKFSTYNVISPAVVNNGVNMGNPQPELEPVTNWGESILKITKNVAHSLLHDGGCLLVKATSRAVCVQLVNMLTRWQKSIKKLPRWNRLQFIPYTAGIDIPTDLKKDSKVVFVVTDIAVFGENFPKCRGVITCGLTLDVCMYKATGTYRVLPRISSLENTFQLFGRIDRMWNNPGLAITIIPRNHPLREEHRTVVIENNDKWMIEILQKKINEFHCSSIVHVNRIRGNELLRLGASGEIDYLRLLLDINYCFSIGGPHSINSIKQLCNLCEAWGVRIKDFRWGVVFTMLFTLLSNQKGEGNQSQWLQVTGNVKKSPHMERVLTMCFIWMMLIENPKDLVFSRVELEWLEQRNNTQHNRPKKLSPLLRRYNSLLGETPKTKSKWGGTGYQKLNFFLNNMKTQKKNWGPSGGDGHYKFQLFPNNDLEKIMNPKVHKEVETTIGHGLRFFLLEEASKTPVIRKHFRLLGLPCRWEGISEIMMFQLVMANTRPLQVVKVRNVEKNRPTPKKGITLGGNMNVDIVDFDDLVWNNKVNSSFPAYCSCDVDRRERERFAYFAKVSMKHSSAGPPVVQVSETIAIAHVIGCMIETWFQNNPEIIRGGTPFFPQMAVNPSLTGANPKLNLGLLYQTAENGFNMTIPPFTMMWPPGQGPM